MINSAVIEYNSKSIPVKTQWNTGATCSCISKEVCNTLELQPTGMQMIHTPSGIGYYNCYEVDLVLNNELVFKNLSIIDSEIGPQGIDMLIGMDIISLGDFAISNFHGKTQFSFRIPSQEHVEYHR